MASNRYERKEGKTRCDIQVGESKSARTEGPGARLEGSNQDSACGYHRRKH